MKIFIVTLFLFLRSGYSSYYKIINTKNNTLLCLETLKENYLTTQFSALKGNCKQQNCLSFVKKKYIPFCCNINIYLC